jgi:hypothetical protein
VLCQLRSHANKRTSRRSKKRKEESKAAEKGGGVFCNSMLERKKTFLVKPRLSRRRKNETSTLKKLLREPSRPFF